MTWLWTVAEQFRWWWRHECARRVVVLDYLTFAGERRSGQIIGRRGLHLVVRGTGGTELVDRGQALDERAFRVAIDQWSDRPLRLYDDDGRRIWW